MLLYNGVRISELLDLKKENVHLEEQYFDVISSKTDNGIRTVPIADKVLPFYKSWYESNDKSEYLLHNDFGVFRVDALVSTKTLFMWIII